MIVKIDVADYKTRFVFSNQLQHQTRAASSVAVELRVCATWPALMQVAKKKTMMLIILWVKRV